MGAYTRLREEGSAMDTGVDTQDDKWWFNLTTQSVEKGPGAGNVDRLGPYDSEAEAAGALSRMHARTEAADSEDDA